MTTTAVDYIFGEIITYNDWTYEEITDLIDMLSKTQESLYNKSLVDESIMTEQDIITNEVCQKINEDSYLPE